MQDPNLTTTDLQVWEYVSRGLTNKQIAERLHVSQPPARYHVSKLLNTFGVSKRTQLATLWAVRYGQPEPS